MRQHKRASEMVCECVRSSWVGGGEGRGLTFDVVKRAVGHHVVKVFLLVGVAPFFPLRYCERN